MELDQTPESTPLLSRSRTLSSGGGYVGEESEIAALRTWNTLARGGESRRQQLLEAQYQAVEDDCSGSCTAWTSEASRLPRDWRL